MKNRLGHGSEKGNRGRPALTSAEKRARLKDRNPNYVRDWKKKNPLLAQAQAKRANDKWRVNHPVEYMLGSAKASARVRELDFAITMADLLPVPERCPVYGVVLEYGKLGPRNNATASIDRTNSSKGYIPGNVKIISWAANRHKNDAT